MQPGNKLVLGAHMLEICPSIADGKPSLQVHPLGIGGKADPARLVFNTPAGPALNASLMDFGNRFRLLINEVDVVKPEQPMPKLPVAQAVWKCRPNFEDACARVDLRRRRASHRLQPGGHDGNARRLRGDGRNRSGRD